jgi:integrase
MTNDPDNPDPDRTKIPLTDLDIRKTKIPAKRLEIRDHGERGHYFIVEKTGTKRFALRCRFKGQQVNFPVGTYPNVSLHKARELARHYRDEFKAGRDPREAKKTEAERAKAAAADTVAAIVDAYLADLRAAPDEERLRSIDQLEYKIKAYIVPEFGARPIASVRRGEIITFLRTLKTKSGTRTSEITYSLMQQVWRWYALAHDDFNSPFIPGMWKQKQRARKRALTDDEIRKIWAAAELMGSYGAMVKFLLLTAARRDEAASMPWSELENGAWILPAERNKGERDGGVELVRPLSNTAKDLLAERPHTSPWPFALNGHPIRGFSTLKKKLDARSGVTGWRVHDLRRTSRSLMSRAKCDRTHSELCLGHKIKGVEGVYDRFSYYSEKLAVYEALAQQVELIVNPPQGGEVIQLRRA